MTAGPLRFAANNHMQRRKIRSPLSAYRRRFGLTQAELAYMLGLSGNPRISRFEDGKAEPPLKVAFGLHVVFGKEAHKIFHAQFAEVEEAVLTRAYDLYERLQGSKSKFTKIKLDFLEQMFERAKQRRKAHI